MTSIVFVAGIVLERSALATGFVAAAIAVGGFLARSRIVLDDGSAGEIQRYTAMGGLTGLGLSMWVIAFDLTVS